MKNKVMVFLACYLITYAGLALKIYFDQSDVDRIKSDPAKVAAKISDVNVSSRIKKGVEIMHYTLLYTFNEGGNDYQGSADMSDDYYKQYDGKSEIEVIYNKSDPAQNMPASVMSSRESNGSFSDKLQKLLIFALIVALIPFSIIGFFLGWIKLN